MAFLVAAIGFVSPISAQPPAFDAASVKPGFAAGAMTGVRGDPGNYRAGNVTLHDLIGFAYRVEEIQISGGPGWAATDRYDVEAKTDWPGQRGQAGSHAPDSAGKTLPSGPDGIPERATASMESLAGMIARMLNPPTQTIETAERLPGIDRTGIQGTFDIDPFLRAVMGDGAGGRGARETSDRLAAIQAAVDGLGLRLAVRKTLVETMVIDRAERPGRQ